MSGNVKITRQDILLSDLQPNTGQIRGVPCNPRKISDAHLAKLCASIESLPEMLDQRPLIVYPLGDAYVVLGGNMRLAALERMGWNSAPCAVLPSVTSAKRLREWVLKDNNLYGEHDFDILSEWDIDEVTEWGGVEWDDIDPLASEEPKEDARNNDRVDDGAEEEEEGPDFFDMMLGDRIYTSDNVYEIPNLLMEEQPRSGLLLPVGAWGADTRAKKGIATYHFYVEDYRFEAIWKDPSVVLKSGCSAVVEPNLSLFDTTPVAYGLHQIYKKRWIARYFQECGVKVYADLNVSRKFYDYNRLGIPAGYDAFATRGYADRQEYLKEEIQIARDISGKDAPNMIVYGGGDRIKDICLQNNVLYVEQFIRNQTKKEV